MTGQLNKNILAITKRKHFIFALSDKDPISTKDYHKIENTKKKTLQIAGSSRSYIN